MWKLPPEAVSLGSTGVSLVMTSRSIAVDPSDSTDVAAEDATSTAGVEGAEQLQRLPALIGELRASVDVNDKAEGGPTAAIDWYRGTLRDYATNRSSIAEAEVAQSLVNSAANDSPLVFFRVGATTFRLFNVTRNIANEGAAAGVEPADSTPYRRAKDKYTAAVAFEFVNDVITNVLGFDLHE